ncbi:mechanosensitive ion channel [Thiomicrorhabdus sp. zzn3]|uniref:mechanosensitive ion channel family protein n=1 Tax=Thiomicrorhabdus sp. zzn3 TaxID=3039775 RepID=UPI002436F32D|nr:mechanosensitive ion channel domain-containing protein [Thiomicrorhabdus sp. zzn3]MDG6777171.1 mechanosensitive ion channel [Thiomicrorhabdus sp. zzn3]
MDFEPIVAWWQHFLSVAGQEVGGVNFYLQIAAVLAAVTLAWFGTMRLRTWLAGAGAAVSTKWWMPPLLALSSVVWPLLSLLLLGVVQSVFRDSGIDFGVIKVSFSLVLIATLYLLIHRFVNHLFVGTLLKWVALPMAGLYLFGWLEPTVAYLQGIGFAIGGLNLSVYALLRLLVFGSILFWLGRISNQYGQQLIRSKQTLDVRTREVFAKLFEIGLYFTIFLLLLNAVGINLTALAVFGGALGVGIGFGLQQIASNFISGLIILMDKSMAIGNYIELEDGKSGILKKMGMRSSTLQTYDGKVIVVPNERFITTAFTNWTHEDPRQRYTLTFSVAYDSDIPAIPELILNAVKQHPQVLLEPELPDCEIIEFADSGVVFQLEYWIEGIDDGKNRVGSDLLMIIWKTLKDNHIAIPFPQREVRILNRSVDKAPVGETIGSQS